MSKRMYIYCMIDTKTNSYDYNDLASTTDDLETAYNWIQEGCKQVAILDALSYEYLGYMDCEDLYRHLNYDEFTGEDDIEYNTMNDLYF